MLNTIVATPLSVFGSTRIVCMEIFVLYWYVRLRAGGTITYSHTVAVVTLVQCMIQD